MLCGLLSLLTNNTWLPRVTVTFLGDTALFEMVMVAALGPGDGLVELLEPQAHVARIPAEQATAPTQVFQVLMWFDIPPN
jgi:hypothetical protein